MSEPRGGRCHADVGALERWRVVDAAAAHGRDLLLGSPRRHEAPCPLGAHAGEDVHVAPDTMTEAA